MTTLCSALGIVHAAWMGWWQLARPLFNHDAAVFDAAQRVGNAIGDLETALRNGEAK